MKEIPITSFRNLNIGQAENTAAGTGCTVFLLGQDGAPAGLDVRGGGPASRESELLKPLAAAQVIHAIVLAGGSAFGLDAAGGVMRYLEERGIGFDVGVTKVPLVCQSDLFDLTVADAHTRPDAAMAYQACVNAEAGNYRDGNYGAGTGATVGKLLGMDHCMKSGIGSYAVQVGPLQVGAVVAVNALGDIYDYETGRKAAGLLADDGRTFLDSELLALQSIEVKENNSSAIQRSVLSLRTHGLTNPGCARSLAWHRTGMRAPSARCIPRQTGTASTLFRWAMWPLIRMSWGATGGRV